MSMSIRMISSQTVTDRVAGLSAVISRVNHRAAPDVETLQLEDGRLRVMRQVAARLPLEIVCRCSMAARQKEPLPCARELSRTMLFGRHVSRSGRAGAHVSACNQLFSSSFSLPSRASVRTAALSRCSMQ